MNPEALTESCWNYPKAHVAVSYLHESPIAGVCVRWNVLTLLLKLLKPLPTSPHLKVCAYQKQPPKLSKMSWPGTVRGPTSWCRCQQRTPSICLPVDTSRLHILFKNKSDRAAGLLRETLQVWTLGFLGYSFQTVGDSQTCMHCASYDTRYTCYIVHDTDALNFGMFLSLWSSMPLGFQTDLFCLWWHHVAHVALGLPSRPSPHQPRNHIFYSWSSLGDLAPTAHVNAMKHFACKAHLAPQVQSRFQMVCIVALCQVTSHDPTSSNICCLSLLDIPKHFTDTSGRSKGKNLSSHRPISARRRMLWSGVPGSICSSAFETGATTPLCWGAQHKDAETRTWSLHCNPAKCTEMQRTRWKNVLKKWLMVWRCGPLLVATGHC